MRTHIAKSLQTHCKAIQNAVKVYNATATALNPPRPTIDWSRVSHYGFLDEFELLRDTRQDISKKPWALPAVRETIKQHHRINRAKEEIVRCNVEIRCLHTSIHDEEIRFALTLQRLQDENHPIAGAVQDYIVRCHRVNEQILTRIFQTHSLDGYSGERTPGTRKGAVVGEDIESAWESAGERVEQDDSDASNNGLDDDEVHRSIDTLVEYISDLALKET